MSESPVPAAAICVANTLELERARLSIALTRIYRAGGFSAAVTASQGSLRALAELVRAEGGSLGDGWVS